LKETNTKEEDFESPKFTPKVWKDVGASVLYALLDYDKINPYSRLIKSKEESLDEALQEIRTNLKNNTLK